MFLKVTVSFQPQPQKNIYQLFQLMIYLAEGHEQTNLPGKSFIIYKNNYFRKGY